MMTIMSGNQVKQTTTRNVKRLSAHDTETFISLVFKFFNSSYHFYGCFLRNAVWSKDRKSSLSDYNYTIKIKNIITTNIKI
jgi:hypothetical protein